MKDRQEKCRESLSCREKKKSTSEFVDVLEIRYEEEYEVRMCCALPDCHVKMR
jgi:hypothetical protein